MTQTNRRNLGVWDGAFQRENTAHTLADATRAASDAGIRRDIEDACYVSDKTTSVANIDRQLGKPMSGAQFKKLVEACNVRLKLEPHPDPTIKTWSMFEIKNVPVTFGMTGLEGGLQKIYRGAVGGFTMDMLPEWSIMGTAERKVPGFDRRDPIGTKHTIPWRQEARGWRAALALLVVAKLVTKPQADKIVEKHGSPARPSWQGTVGESERKDFLS